MNKETYSKVLIATLALVMTAYVVYRSIHLPFFHDECGTYNFFHDTNLLHCFTSEDCWPNANNHLLNTFSMQLGIKLFGAKEWAMRLGNNLCYALYAICSVLIIISITNKLYLIILGFGLLNFNPYMLDFFSLARGYGMSLGFIMGSIYFITRFFKNEKKIFVILSFLLAFLAVMSNFTAINFYASIWIAYFILRFSRNFRKTLVNNSIPFILAISLAILLYKPIFFLQKKDEFLFGCDTLVETFSYLIKDSLYSQFYTSQPLITIIMIIGTILSLISVATGIYQIMMKKCSPYFTNIFLLITLTLLMILAFMVAQNIILGSKFFVNRKSLVFITLIGLVVFLGFVVIDQYLSRVAVLLSAVLLLVMIFHLGLCFRYDTVKEWFYDRYTKEVLFYLESHADPTTKISLGLHWTFFPASEFYRETRNLKYIKPPVWDRENAHVAGCDYYYTYKEDYEALKGNYEVEKIFGGFGYLLRKKKLKEPF